MSLTKTFIGYHVDDGGKVYKETFGSNSLLSNTYCSFCSKSTAFGNLNVSAAVSSDMTAISIALGGDAPGTDDEWRDAHASAATLWNASFSAVGVGPASLSQPYSLVHAIAAGTGHLGTLNTAQFIQNDNSLLALGQSMQTTGLDVAPTNLQANDTTTRFVTSYSYFASTTATSKIESTTNMYLDLVDTWPVMVCANPAAEATIVSNDYVTPAGFNQVHLALYGITAEQQFQDWTRGVTTKFEVSSDGGSTWVGSKFINMYPDDTSPFKYYEYFVSDFEVNAGNTFKWRLTFLGGAQFDYRAFQGMIVQLSYAVPDTYYNSLRLDRYV